MQLSETLTRRGEIRHSPMVTWTNRLFFGLRAVALRLLGRANLKRINDEEVARAGIVFD
jgi:hypothetical protein